MQEAYGSIYTELYHRHWWWRSREAIVLHEIRQLGLTSGAKTPIDILDVGCGNGLFLPKLSELGRVTGIETDVRLLSHDTPMRDRIYTEPLGSALYADKRFDLVTALDVIEHIHDDQAAVEHMIALLKPNGRLVVTVPAHQSLWSTHDDINHHYRRYGYQQLRDLLGGCGRIRIIRYFNHALYVPKRILAFLGRYVGTQLKQERIPNRLLNGIARWWCEAEYRLCAARPPPIGSSLIAVVAPPPLPLHDEWS